LKADLLELSPITFYGATEAGVVASGDARVTIEVPGAVGFVLPDAQAEIVDDAEMPIKSVSEGIVRAYWIRATTYTSFPRSQGFDPISAR